MSSGLGLGKGVKWNKNHRPRKWGFHCFLPYPLMEPKVGIVTINYKNTQDTLETLDSLRGLDYENFEVFVVDNEYTPETKKKLEKARKDFGFELLLSEKNLGFGGGNNFGAKKALEKNCEFVLFLNNDTAAEPDFLAKLVGLMKKDKEIGICGPRINYFSDQNLVWFNGGKADWLKIKWTHRDINAKEQTLRWDTEPRETDYIAGTAMLVRAKVFFEIGFWSDDYFMYCEDPDFCLRAARRGYKIVFAPSAKIYHKISPTTKPGSETYIYYHTRNGLILAWKYNGWLKRGIVVVYSFLRLFKQLPKFLSQEKRKWALGVLKGTRDFYLRRKGKTRNF